MTGVVPSRSATASRAAVGHLALGLGAGGEDDPGRRRAQGVEVGLVVGARDHVLAEQHVGPRAVVLGRHARTSPGPAPGCVDEVGRERALVADDRDEVGHAGAEAAALVGLVDRLGGRQGGLAVGEDRASGGSCATSVRTSLRMRRDERQRVHRAAAAREQVDRPGAERLDDPMQVVGVLLGRRLGRPGRPSRCAPTPRGS